MFNKLKKLVVLPGPYTLCKEIPKLCSQCGCKEFYKQSDFRRSIGITLVSIASIATFVLMYLGFNWFVIWSPMFLFLLFDRVVFRITPDVLICYKCQHNYRGLEKNKLEEVEDFDLEKYDRYLYREENKELR